MCCDLRRVGAGVGAGIVTGVPQCTNGKAELEPVSEAQCNNNERTN